MQTEKRYTVTDPNSGEQSVTYDYAKATQWQIDHPGSYIKAERCPVVARTDHPECFRRAGDSDDHF